jgi:DNA repair protein RecN (Recombination protein N)
MMAVREGRGRLARRPRGGGGRAVAGAGAVGGVAAARAPVAQAPALIEPAVKSLDAALAALEEARAHLDAALRAADHDPHELEKIEERLFALRAAARKYTCRSTRSRRWPTAMPPISA